MGPVCVLLRGWLAPALVRRTHRVPATAIPSPPTSLTRWRRFPQDAPDPGRGQLIHSAGQGTGHPPDLTVRAGDDLQVHAVAAILAGVERPIPRPRSIGTKVSSSTT